MLYVFDEHKYFKYFVHQVTDIENVRPSRWDDDLRYRYLPRDPAAVWRPGSRACERRLRWRRVKLWKEGSWTEVPRGAGSRRVRERGG